MIEREIKPTNDATRSAAVKQATGARIANIEVINNGISNEVLGVSTESGDNVILRTSRRSESRAFYLGERHATRLCSEAGINVPKILALNSFEQDGEIFYTSVGTRLPGVAMSEYLKECPEAAEQLAAEAGRVLREINKLPAEQFGFLDRRFLWQKNTVHDVLGDPWIDRTAMLAVAEKIELSPDVLNKVYDRYDLLRAKFPDIEARLLHNDFGVGNIMVHNGKISGVIDFELAAGGDPAREIAQWDLNTKHPETTAALVGAWHNGSAPSPDFELRFEAWKIQIIFINLRYFSGVSGDVAKRFIDTYKVKLTEFAENL